MFEKIVSKVYIKGKKTGLFGKTEHDDLYFASWSYQLNVLHCNSFVI